MCCEVGDAANGVALDLDVWREHLPDERLEATQSYNERLVLS